jgi:hypothetical protein
LLIKAVRSCRRCDQLRLQKITFVIHDSLVFDNIMWWLYFRFSVLGFGSCFESIFTLDFHSTLLFFEYFELLL